MHDIIIQNYKIPGHFPRKQIMFVTSENIVLDSSGTVDMRPREKTYSNLMLSTSYPGERIV